MMVRTPDGSRESDGLYSAISVRDLRGNVWTRRPDGWWESDGEAPRPLIPAGSVPHDLEARGISFHPTTDHPDGVQDCPVCGLITGHEDGCEAAQ